MKGKGSEESMCAHLFVCVCVGVCVWDSTCVRVCVCVRAYVCACVYLNDACMETLALPLTPSTGFC